MRVQQLAIRPIDHSYSCNPSLVVVALDHDALLVNILRGGKRRRDTLNASARNAGRSTRSGHSKRILLIVCNIRFLVCVSHFLCLAK